jgi:hypothetical protein
MRVLKFLVEGDTIKADPTCGFGGLFPGRNNHVQAEFTFSPEWKSRVKVAAFWSPLDHEYTPQPIEEDGTCMIPVEALQKSTFKVQILTKINGVITSTNKLTVYQKGG